MTEVVYIVAALLLSLGAWDGFRRWVEAKQAATLALDKNEHNQRSIMLLQEQMKVRDKQIEALASTTSALRMGLDECIVRLDTIKAGNWPTREQVRELEEHCRKELHELDDELRRFWKRLDTNEAALTVTAGEVRELVQKQTAYFATRAGNVRAG